MSRRKQAKPIRHLEDGSPVFNGEGAQVASTSLASATSAGGHSDDAEIALGSSSDPEHSSLSDHARDQDASALSEEAGEELEEGSSEPSASVAPNLFLKRSVDEDFANNNDHQSRRRLNQLEDEEAMDTDEAPTKKDPEDPQVPSFLQHAPTPAGGNLPSSSAVTEQLKNISLTISQLTSNLTNTASNPKSVQELAVLQATLFSLQQQQLLHMQILAQMQQQQKHHLAENESSDSSEKSKELSPVPTIAELAKKMEVQNTILDPNHHPLNKSSLGIIPTSSLSESQPDKHSRRDSLESTPLPPSLPPKSLNIPTSNVLTGKDLKVTSTPVTSSSNNAGSKSDSSNLSLSSQILDPNAPSSLASSIILHPEGPTEEKPVNSLELLQKRAQGILNSASQGLLANNLADFSINKDREFDKKGEPFFKHRCRYCGKVFGSDSALQIHVRSHTGERPYKCNVCGNRFTTKGNLKVHFQRHSNKFPHVKMNPNLVPEHLDKFYPPLLQLIEEAEKKGLPIAPLVQNPMAGMTPIFPPGFKLPNALQGFPPVSSAASHLLGDHVPSLPRFPLSGLGGAGSGLPPPSGLFPPFPPLPSEPLKREDVPQNLSGFNLKRSRSRSRSRSPSPGRENTEEIDVMDRNEEKRARSTDSAENRRSVSPDIVDKMSDNEDGLPGKEDLSGDDQPENLSKFRERSSSPSPNNDRDHSPVMPTAPSIAAKLFPNIPGLAGFPGVRLPISRPPGMPGLPLVPPVVTSNQNSVDPAKDPMIYTNLLPRPGSSDNSWESLIEIEKASDTAKLEQLVNNIENKLTDPNECVICHRVLSCKSALQMHYRTHTGERPFKCRICSRAFTTKGNLKTHMGVHRAKPPMRMFHQCPVCHKKYANALVLQQHIRTHTGEPTELTAEQIAAAEIRDFPPLPPGHPLTGGPLRHPASSLFPGAIPGYFPPVSGPGSDPMSPDIYDKDDKDSAEEKEDGTSRPSSVSSSTSSTLNTSYPMNSIPTSVTDNRPEFRPFGLVRPIQMEKLGQLSNLLADSRAGIPEDLSRRSEDKSPVNNGRKESASPAVSPPKFSPEPENSHKPEMSSPKKPEQINGSSLKIPVSSAVPTSAGMFSAAAAAAAAAALERSGSGPMAPSGMMFPGFPGLLPPTGAFPGHLLSQSPPVSGGAGSVLSQLALAGNPAAFNPLGLPGLPGVPPVSRAAGGLPMTRGNTTCQLCFKTFACNSALEIHYRSHTKERPFKCAVCDRGFSTKGNMKQHFLTHKNREGIKCSPSHSNSNPNSDCEQPKTPNALHRQSAGHDSEGSNDNSRPEAISLKRSPPEEDSLPIAKRLQGASDVSDLSLRPEDRTSPSTSTSSAELRIPATAARNVLQFPTATAN